MSGQESGGPDAIGPVAIGPIAIGIDIGATKVLGGVVDVGTGSVLYSEEIPALPRRDPEVVLDDIVGFAARLKNAAERDALAVHGLGGGIPEIVDPAGNLSSPLKKASPGFTPRRSISRRRFRHPPRRSI